MSFFKLSPEQKRERKREMYNEWQKRNKKQGIILYDLRSELATKYGYKNQKVVEQTIIRIENIKKEKENATIN